VRFLGYDWLLARYKQNSKIVSENHFSIFEQAAELPDFFPGAGTR
jgi:hypothetical protein